MSLLQQLSLKTARDLEPACGDLSDGEEQVLKARRYSGIFSPSKRGSSESPEAASVPSWSPADSAALYNVPGWGAEYFKASDDGHMLVSPKGGELPPAACLPACLPACRPRATCRCPSRGAPACAASW